MYLVKNCVRGSWRKNDYRTRMFVYNYKIIRAGAGWRCFSGAKHAIISFHDCDDGHGGGSYIILCIIIGRKLCFSCARECTQVRRRREVRVFIRII